MFGVFRRSSVETCPRLASCGPVFCRLASVARLRCVWNTFDLRGTVVLLLNNTVSFNEFVLVPLKADQH